MLSSFGGERIDLCCISNIIILILSLINRCGCKLSFRCEGQPDLHEYTCTNANEISTQNADKSLISNAVSIGGPIEVKHTLLNIYTTTNTLLNIFVDSF